MFNNIVVLFEYLDKLNSETEYNQPCFAKRIKVTFT